MMVQAVNHVRGLGWVPTVLRSVLKIRLDPFIVFNHIFNYGIDLQMELKKISNGFVFFSFFFLTNSVARSELKSVV